MWVKCRERIEVVIGSVDIGFRRAGARMCIVDKRVDSPLVEEGDVGIDPHVQAAGGGVGSHLAWEKRASHDTQRRRRFPFAEGFDSYM